MDTATLTPVLITERLLLRPLALADAPAAFAGWTADPAVTYYMPYETHRSLRETEQWLASEEARVALPERYNWGITERSGGQLVGTVGLVLEGDTAEIGYCLSRSRWGRGYMTEAAHGVLDYGRRELGLASCYARVALDNGPSARVLQKLGFTDAGPCSYSSYDGTSNFPSRKYVLVWAKQAGT